MNTKDIYIFPHSSICKEFDFKMKNNNIITSWDIEDIIDRINGVANNGTVYLYIICNVDKSVNSIVPVTDFNGTVIGMCSIKRFLEKILDRVQIPKLSIHTYLFAIETCSTKHNLDIKKKNDNQYFQNIDYENVKINIREYFFKEQDGSEESRNAILWLSIQLLLGKIDYVIRSIGDNKYDMFNQIKFQTVLTLPPPTP